MGFAEGLSGEFQRQEDQVFKLKTQSALIAAQLAKEQAMWETQKASPEVGDAVFKQSGLEPTGKRYSNAELGLLGKTAVGMKNAEARAKSFSGRPMISGATIMQMLPNGEQLGLNPQAMYPYSMANFAANATKMGMGTADMRNQLVGIDNFEGGLKKLKESYDSFNPDNPLVATLEEKWAKAVKGWSSEKADATPGSANAEGRLQEVLRDANNAEIADMMAQRIELAMEYARATNGARPSDRDFLNALQVIPAWSSDPQLREYRFNHLARTSETKRESVFKQAEKLRPPKEKNKPKGGAGPSPEQKVRDDFKAWRAAKKAREQAPESDE